MRIVHPDSNQVSFKNVSRGAVFARARGPNGGLGYPHIKIDDVHDGREELIGNSVDLEDGSFSLFADDDLVVIYPNATLALVPQP